METAVDYQVEVRDLTNDEYHQDRTAIGKTGLWTFHKRKRLYEAEYVLGNAPKKEPTKAMDFGSLADVATLEPERLGDMYAVMPADLLSSDGGIRSNAAKAHRDALKAEGKIIVTDKQFDVLTAVVQSIHSKFGRWLSQPSRRQESIFWTEPETGIRCKCRPDWRMLQLVDGEVVVIDMKATADASPFAFARRCEEFGYHVQDAHYSEGVAALTSMDVTFYFLVVEHAFPYACNLQRIKPDDRESARELRRAILRDLRECRETGNYADHWESDIIDINLRPFCFER